MLPKGVGLNYVENSLILAMNQFHPSEGSLINLSDSEIMLLMQGDLTYAQFDMNILMLGIF